MNDPGAGTVGGNAWPMGGPDFRREAHTSAASPVHQILGAPHLVHVMRAKAPSIYACLRTGGTHDHITCTGVTRAPEDNQSAHQSSRYQADTAVNSRLPVSLLYRWRGIISTNRNETPRSPSISWRA